MEEKSLGEKLRCRRELLGDKQKYLAAKLKITQPACSDIENGKTKFTEQLIVDVQAIPGYEDFQQDKPAHEYISGGQTIVDKWPWGKPSLYLVILIISLSSLDYVLTIPGDIMRGFDDGTGHRSDTLTIIIGFILVVLLALFIYWFFWVKKWWKGRVKIKPEELIEI